jgi:GT2 family glycosyltransferase
MNLKDLSAMKVKMQNVHLVIPFFNGDDYIENCLDSIKANTVEISRIIIVNNSDIPTNIHKIAKYHKNIDLIETKPRIGFGKACNKGAQYAIENGAEFIICTNQDVIFGPTVVSDLIDSFSEKDNIVMSAPIIYTYDFKNMDSFFLKWYLSQCPELIYDALKQNLQQKYQTPSIPGTCFAVKSEFIKQFGLFDSLFFMYREDDDLCRRIMYLGYDIVIVPSAAVAHSPGHLNPAMEKWQRYSSAILELKDPEKSFLYALVRKGFQYFWEDLGLFVSFRFMRLYNNIISDIKLVISLAKVFRKRRNESAVLTKKNI